MLRKGPAIVPVLTCWALAVLLEHLHIDALKKQGFPTNNKTMTQLARYCPIIGVIFHGFGWNPLSKMSNHHAVCCNVRKMGSVLEIAAAGLCRPSGISVCVEIDSTSTLAHVYCSYWWSAFWFWVTLANSLTFVNLSSPVKEDTGLAKISQFSFHNTLATPHGTLYMPWNYLGQQPCATLVSSRQPNGINARWTTNDFAFESFDISQWSNTKATSPPAREHSMPHLTVSPSTMT